MKTVRELVDNLNFLLGKGYIKEDDFILFGSPVESFGNIEFMLPKVKVSKEIYKNSGVLMFCDKREGMYDIADLDKSYFLPSAGCSDFN